MVKATSLPVSVDSSAATAGRTDPPSTVPVVILDEAMLATGFLRLRSAVSLLLRSGSSTLVVDVSALERLSSSTVSALLWAQRRCRIGGGSIVLRGASRRILRTLGRTGLNHVFDIESASDVGKYRSVAQ